MADDDRSIFDACMELSDLAEADAEDPTAESKDKLVQCLGELHGFLSTGEDLVDDIDMFVGEDGIEHTMAAAVRHAADDTTAALCWRILSLVCTSAETRRAIKNTMDNFDHLLSALTDSTGEPPMQQILLQVCERLCIKDEGSKVQLHERGATDHILGLFETTTADNSIVLESALNALRAMLLDDDKEKPQTFRGEFAMDLKEKDALNMLFDLLDGDPAETVRGGVFRVLALLCTHAELCQEAVDNGAIDLALELLREPAALSVGLARAVITLLRSIALQSEEGKGILVGEGAAGLLLGISKAHAGQSRVLDVALSTMLTLIFRDTTQSEALIADGLLKCVHVTLEQHGRDKSIFRASCMLLRELCRTSEQRALIVEQGFDAVIKELMAAHEGQRFAGDTQALSEYGRDVLRDSKSDKYEVSNYSMGVNLVELCGF